MPKPNNKNDKSLELDDDYEVVSFEEFCDKPSNAKADLLSLNDNINYRIYYESLKLPKEGSSTNTEEAFDREIEGQKETSLNGPKGGVYTKLPFAPFGKGGVKSRAPLFSGIIPKPRSDGDNSREPRYQRFSQRRTTLQRAWEQLKNICPGMLGVGLMCVLCVAVWLVVGGTLGGAWTEDKYRKLWQRVHPENTERPMTYYEMVVPEVHYHDHNNLSTKNKFNGSEGSKKTPLDDEKYQRLMRPKPIQVPTEAPETTKYLEKTPEMLRNVCSNVKDNMRFDCYPQAGANEESCVKRGCCWRSTNIQGAPYCFYPPDYESYTLYNSTEDKRGVTAYYKLVHPSGYPGDFRVVRLDLTLVTGEIMNVKITDAENPRFEAQYPEIPMVYGSIKTMKYRTVLDNSRIGFKVIRLSDNVTVFNTQEPKGVVLSDKFLQFSSLLPTNQIYGLGERRARFRTEMKEWKTFTLFNSDQAPVENTNLYGTQPFYLGLEPDGKAHGMLLLNSHAIDVVVQPSPAITFRSIGGMVNLYLFVGPTPADVAAQLTQIIGKPFMPPYWALGFHLCKYNYGSLQVTRDVWKSNRDAGIPLDVQWNDLDYMKDGNDFTYDEVKFKGLPDFVKELHDAGMHYMVLFDPGVSAAEKAGAYPPFDKGLEMNVFIKNSTGQPFVGKVWNKVSTVWPDFTHPNATVYWTQMMSNFHKKIPYDGAWIDMNEPSNFVSGSLYGECAPEDLPYTPQYLSNGLKHKTLCMDARQYAGEHFHWHNLYGLTEAIATHFALVEIRGSRPFIISRASFPGLGRYAGHWSGDVDSSWHDLRMSIPELLSFSLFGIPMMGADICGFRGNTTAELCRRWMQLGAFYPFSRNHNSDSSMPQDPVSLGAEVVSASRTALRTRYLLLPYYYTLFWRAHLHGELVARPLYFDDPSDTVTHDIDTQFLIGPYLLISPILWPGTDTAHAYFPAGIWYGFDGTPMTPGWRNVTEKYMLAVKGGGILPLQEPPEGVVTTRECRTRPLQLLVAPDAAGQAKAMLYWDDGLGLQTYDESKYSLVHFTLDKQEFRSELQWWAYGMPSLNKITIFGQKDVQWNDLDYMKDGNDFTYDEVKFKGLPDFVKELHDAGMHYMVLFDPGVSAAEKAGTYPPFDRGLEMNVFIKNSTGQPFVGKVWNKVSTVWPDFTHPNATVYWTQMMSNFHKKIPYDGAWIDMNEPSNFVSGSLYGECAPEDLPYTPQYLSNGLKHKTLCMDARQYAGEHFHWHNLYGLTEAIATHFALVEIRGSRPFIISRASFPGLGRYAGHWSGDVDSSWHDLRMSIPELLSFSLFGIPMMGADICGFRGNTTAELCRRWMQLGAFYPFSRNHNSDSSMPQDPVSLGAEVVSASRTALRTRYLLLPYYYTLFWRAHLHGELVARPLYFDDPSDIVTHDIDTQFLIGPYLLISPILWPGTDTAHAYFPAGIWYGFDGTPMTPGWRNVTEKHMLAVKGGGILPLQEPPEGVVTTRECRTRPLQLLVAPDAAGQAKAMLYWDDGLGLQTYDESKYSLVHFTLDKQEFRSELQWWAYGMPSLNKVTIFGQKVPIKNVTINQKPCKKPVCEFSYTSNTQIFVIFNINLRLNEPIHIQWMLQDKLKDKN